MEARQKTQKIRDKSQSILTKKEKSKTQMPKTAALITMESHIFDSKTKTVIENVSDLSSDTECKWPKPREAKHFKILPKSW